MPGATGVVQEAGVWTQVGFNYLCNPMLALAREIICSGELGEIRSYRGIHAEDYMADAASPFDLRREERCVLQLVTKYDKSRALLSKAA